MKIGLCLAGGGTKGIAHIGAIKAFEEQGIEFDYIAGTSSGSIISTLYAIGYTPEEMYEIFKKYIHKITYIDARNIIKIVLNFFKTGKIKIDGLNSGESIYKIINKVCREKGICNINQIKKPLLIPAVNIYNEDLYVFYSKSIEKLDMPKNIKYINNADIGAVVQASCSYPGIFCPCDKFKNLLLIDGGIQENVPWREEKRVGAEKVVSIVFGDNVPTKCCNSIWEIINKSFEILCHELARHEWNGSDYLLEIKSSSKGLLNKKNLDKLYVEGYEQTKKFLKENKNFQNNVKQN